VSKRGGQYTQLQVFQAATAFLRAVADISPVVLVLEDLHWADSTSLGLLLYLGRHVRTAQILVLGTYRDVQVGRQHPLDDTLRELTHTRERLVDDVRLRRLDVSGTAALLSTQLAAESISDELVALVHERAEGNPFFTEELLKALLEQGDVYESGGRWLHKRLNEIEVPRSVRSVVGQRVSRLPSGEQELLHLASVLGPEWELDVLLAASASPESVVLDQLDALLGARLLEERRGVSSERYGFTHVLIQQTLYQELPIHRQRRLHRRVGDALERMYAVHPLYAADLARHFLLAGDRDRAAQYATTAGDQAGARYAHAEAAHHYEIALELLVESGDGRRAAEVQYRLANELCDLKSPGGRHGHVRSCTRRVRAVRRRSRSGARARRTGPLAPRPV
jgi:predicted ATPase